MADPKALVMDQCLFVHPQNKKTVPLVQPKGYRGGGGGGQGEKQTQSGSRLRVNLFSLKEMSELVLRKEQGCSCSMDHS